MRILMLFHVATIYREAASLYVVRICVCAVYRVSCVVIVSFVVNH